MKRRRSALCGGTRSIDPMKPTPTDMTAGETLRIGITCYPSVGGSGGLATARGEELAGRGHGVHSIGYERRFRLPADGPRLYFLPVVINDYERFSYPEYTLPPPWRM